MCMKQILRRDFELLVKIRTYRVKYSNGMIQVMVRDYTIGNGHDIDRNQDDDPQVSTDYTDRYNSRMVQRVLYNRHIFDSYAVYI